MIEEDTKNVPAHNVIHPFNKLLPVRISLPGWRCSTFELVRGPYQKRETRLYCTQLHNAAFAFELKKGELLSKTINYLGPVIHPVPQAIITNQSQCDSPLRVPTNISKLKPFLGLRNVFRGFVPSFARISATLNTCVEKDHPMHFKSSTEDGLIALRTLQQRLIHLLVLSLLQWPYSYA